MRHELDPERQFKLEIRNLIRKEPQWSSTIDVARRASVYVSGERDGNVYHIDCGRVKLVMCTPEGRECVLKILTAGDIFGEQCLSGDLDRLETAVAMQDTRLTAMPCRRILEMLRRESQLEDLIRYLTAVIAHEEEFIGSMLTINSEQRLAKVLLDLAASLGNGNSDGSTIRPGILYEDLAAMVGTTRSRVGFFIQRFRKRGLVAMNADHSLTIEPEKLRRFAAKSEFD